MVFVNRPWDYDEVRPAARPTGFSASELMTMEFAEPRFAVPGILAEGLNFVVGAPKLGKSWMALGMAVAVAGGGRAFGTIPVERGDVLYLALEDSARRLQGRLARMLDGEPAPMGLRLEIEWQRLSEGGTDRIADWVNQVANPRLVMVDVFARVRPRVRDSADRYLADYEAAQPLKALGDEHGLAVVALHHTRKAAADDYVETISGTHGLAASADTIIVVKRSRGQPDATLQVTGRDVEEQELALRFASEAGTWALLGDAREWAMSETRRKILEALRGAPAMKPKQIADEIDADHGVVKHLVRRMVDDGQLDTDGNGYYMAPSTAFTSFTHSPKEGDRGSSSERGEQSERPGAGP
jgi:RecA-family ATPase